MIEAGPRKPPYHKRHFDGYDRQLWTRAMMPEAKHGKRYDRRSWDVRRGQNRPEDVYSIAWFPIGGSMGPDRPIRGPALVVTAESLLIGLLYLLCITIPLFLALRRRDAKQTVIKSSTRSGGSAKTTDHHITGPSVKDCRGLVEPRRIRPDDDSSLRHRVTQKTRNKNSDHRSQLSWKRSSVSSSSISLVGGCYEQDGEPEQDH